MSLVEFDDTGFDAWGTGIPFLAIVGVVMLVLHLAFDREADNESLYWFSLPIAGVVYAGLKVVGVL